MELGDCRNVLPIGGMISKPPEPSIQECARWIHTNLGDPDSYPRLREYMEELVDEAGSLAVGRRVPGAITSGATEGNILALMYWRDQGYRRVVFPSTAHYSIIKASKILNINYKLISINIKKYNIDLVEKMESVIERGDIVVLTLGTTELGLIDPVDRIAEIAQRRGAVIHVDAAFLGPVMRFLPEPVEISLEPPIGTLVLDFHKIPEAPLPLGVILASDETIIDSLYFESEYIPTGRQFGLLGSRPGCTVYSALESLRFLRQRFGDFTSLARTLVFEMRRLVTRLSEIAGYRPVVPVRVPISCVTHDRIEDILSRADSNGVPLYRCRSPRGIRLVMMPHHIYRNETPCILKLLSALATAEHRIAREVPTSGWNRGAEERYNEI